MLMRVAQNRIGLDLMLSCAWQAQGNESEQPRQLYQVLEQKQVSVGATSIMGTDHVYVIPGGEAGKKDKKK